MKTLNDTTVRARYVELTQGEVVSVLDKYCKNIEKQVTQNEYSVLQDALDILETTSSGITVKVRFEEVLNEAE